jgi:hypothetical protein
MDGFHPTGSHGGDELHVFGNERARAAHLADHLSTRDRALHDDVAVYGRRCRLESRIEEGGGQYGRDADTDVDVALPVALRLALDVHRGHTGPGTAVAARARIG